MRLRTPQRLGTPGGHQEDADPSEACPLAAAFAVIQDMLAFKYGLQLDESDFVSKARARCDTADRSSPSRLAAALNSEPALRLKDVANDRVVQLQLQVSSITSFAELRSHIRRWPGTASA